MTSNVKLRSNVYLRLPVHVREDPQYRSKVRGREALRKLLAKIEILDTQERAGRWLTPYQAQEWAEATRCADCEMQVVGPVRRGETVTTEFRCPQGACPYQRGGETL